MMPAPKGNGLDAANDQPAKTDTKDATHSIANRGKFIGTDNPRWLRAIAALERRPMPRESLDHEAGCSNAPELVAMLRQCGLDVPCERITFIDRDGYKCRPGVYSLTAADRNKIRDWKIRRAGGANA